MASPDLSSGSIGQLHDQYVFNTTHFDGLLACNAERLFLPAGQIRIKIIEVGAQDHLFTGVDQLADHLSKSKFQGTRIILIPQRFSWDSLGISQSALDVLMRHFKIFPSFIDIVCAFGKSTSDTDTLGGCYSWRRNGISEICYLLKIVEKHGRDEADEPWSIRQLGLYHQHETATGADTFIVLNPVMSFQQRLKSARCSNVTPPTSYEIQKLALSHSTWGWRWYLSFWESKLSDLIIKAHASQMDSKDDVATQPLVTIDYTDFQTIQVIHDRMNAVKYVLESNLNICSKVEDSEASSEDLKLFAQELQLQYSRVSSLLERTSSGSSLNIISFRGLNALKTSSENSNEMARLAEIDTKNMVALTKKSQKDASALKKMTWLTSIYLPASFISQFLSMGYVTVNVKARPASLHIAPELCIFFVLTFILLGITFGAWLYLDTSNETRWWRRQRPRGEAASEKV
ncbi:hypothetical protein ACN47E_004186 [Coniothyrium glycines]